MANLRQCDKCGTTEKYVSATLGAQWQIVRGKDLCPKCDSDLEYWLNQPVSANRRGFQMTAPKPPQCEICFQVPCICALSEAAPAPQPYDTLYVVEHMRQGKWRLHIGLEVCTVRSWLELKEIPRLKKEWPDGQFRITEYHPDPAAPVAVPAGPREKDETNRSRPVYFQDRDIRFCKEVDENYSAAPAPLPPPQEPTNSCNRHSNCKAAEEEVMARRKIARHEISFSFHCHDEDCEDCFGC